MVKGYKGLGLRVKGFRVLEAEALRALGLRSDYMVPPFLKASRLERLLRQVGVAGGRGV